MIDCEMRRDMNTPKSVEAKAVKVARLGKSDVGKESVVSCGQQNGFGSCFSHLYRFFWWETRLTTGEEKLPLQCIRPSLLTALALLAMRVIGVQRHVDG